MKREQLTPEQKKAIILDDLLDNNSQDNFLSKQNRERLFADDLNQEKIEKNFFKE